MALQVLKDPLPARLRAVCAAAALLRGHKAPGSAHLDQQPAAGSEGGASHTQQSKYCSGQQLAILGHCPRLHWLGIPWERHGSRHYGTASKAAQVLPADSQSNQHDRSALLQAVARIAQEVGPDSFNPDDTPLVGVTRPSRPTAGGPDVYACNMLIGPRSNMHHYWLQPLMYVEAAVAYDLGRSTLLGPRYTVNFHPDAYSSRDRELMQRHLQQWRPSVFVAAMQSSAAQTPLTYDCLEARNVADRAVTAAAENLARSAEGSYADAAVADTDFRGCISLTNGTYRAVLYEWVKQSGISTKAANSTRSSSKKVFHYRTHDTKLAAAVAADAMKQALGRPAQNFPADVVASALPAMKRWKDLNRLRFTVEQDEWAAKAKAAMRNLQSDDLRAAAGVSIGDMQQQQSSRTSGKKGALATSVDSGNGRRRRRRQHR